MRRPKDNFPNMERAHPNVSFPVTLRAHNTRDRLGHWARQIETQEHLIANARHQVHCHSSRECRAMQRHYAMKRRQRERSCGMRAAQRGTGRKRGRQQRPRSAAATFGWNTKCGSADIAAAHIECELTSPVVGMSERHVSTSDVVRHLHRGGGNAETGAGSGRHKHRAGAGKRPLNASRGYLSRRNHRRSRDVGAKGSEAVVCAGTLCIC